MKKIFISYRRVDSYEANRLATTLKSEYGDNNIFLDFDSMKPGEIWPDSLKHALNSADALLLIISKNWLHMQDEESGKRRIDLEDDWVRKEIIDFLKRKKENPDLLILPVLINGAKMPEKKYLDDTLNEICDFQAIELIYTGSTIDYVQIKHRLVMAKIFSNSPPPVVTPILDMPPDNLTKEEEDKFLDKYKFWKIIEREKPGYAGDVMRELYRMYEFTSYEDAWKFMIKVDENGVKPYNHHPRWQNTYNRVEVWLCTFNIGHKPSYRDLRLAKIFEETWEKFVLGLK
jgi:pterin-4a-carbinolamine dehydratase